MNENQVRCWSLWQPYADACVDGFKLLETRSYNVNVRGTVYIQATARKELPIDVYVGIHRAMHPRQPFIGSDMYFRYAMKNKEDYQAILGSVDIVGCYPIEKFYGGKFDTPLERAYGDWTPGRFGIILANPKRLEMVVPVRGHQGFWYMDKRLFAGCIARIGGSAEDQTHAGR